MEQKLSFIQKQKQKFSNKLVPSMEMLQLSQQDLENLVDASLLDNPFSDFEQKEKSIELRDADLDYKIVNKKAGDLQDFDLVDENKNDLLEYVMPQLTPYINNSKEDHIYKTILESLDSRGFLITEKKDLCLYLQINQDQLNYYLNIIGHLEPKGLGTTNIIECVKLQLEDLENSTLSLKLIQYHLNDIKNANFVKISKEEKVTPSEVYEAINLIQNCNPLPANGFKVDTKTVYIIPDAYISLEDNEIKILMNDSLEKKIKLNSTNYELYKSGKIDESSREFLKEKLKDFRLLQYNVSRRMITVKRVISYLVEYQKEYFKSGDANCLKPLRLRDISAALNIHQSTVSRAIANKFFQCEFDVFPFRFLIPRSYIKKGKQALSSNTIKNEIKEIIRLEDKTAPYTDKEIYDLLSEEGFDISRRSVSLYRKECQIPSSRNRKKI